MYTPYCKERSIKMAERLGELRKNKGKSREEVARELSDPEGKYRVDISTDSIAKYEQTNPERKNTIYTNDGMKVGYLRAFADYYDVSADYLLGIDTYQKKETDLSISDLGLWEKSASNLRKITTEDPDKAKWTNLFLSSGQADRILELMKNHYLASIAGHAANWYRINRLDGTDTEQQFLDTVEKLFGSKAIMFLSANERTQLYDMFCCIFDTADENTDDNVHNPVSEVVNSFGGVLGIRGLYEAQGGQIIGDLLRWSSALAVYEYHKFEQQWQEEKWG